MSEERLLLSEVPRVSFYDPNSARAPEDVPFPSCLAAAARYLGSDLPWLPQPKGAPVNFAYILPLAASGMAFGLRWKAGRHPDNVDHMFIADPEEIIRRAFAAVGYRYTTLSRAGNPDGPGTPADEARFRREIIASLQRGVPVLAFGVIGPPECCLVTGYEALVPALTLPDADDRHVLAAAIVGRCPSSSNASTNHWGLRPRPDQVSAGFSGCRYFAAAGARGDFVSVPTSSARE